MPLRWSGEGIGERFAIHIALLAELDRADRSGLGCAPIVTLDKPHEFLKFGPVKV